MLRALCWLIGLTVFLLAGCSQNIAMNGPGAAPTDSPEAFLKWSMDKHAALKSLQAEINWNAEFGGVSNPAMSVTRTLAYVSPNKFKIVASRPNMVQISVSNGTKLVEYNQGLASPAQSYEAPSSIATSTSMQMGHPMFCGSLYYKFFAGSADLDKLANTAKPITFGSDEKAADGEDSRVVKFYSTGMYGNAEVLIGKTTGLVHRIRYDSAELIKMMTENEEVKKMSGGVVPKPYWTTEKFTKLSADKALDDKTFDVTLPKGMTVTDAGGSEAPKPPVPLGKPAPDFEVTSVDGKKQKLSDLKGKVVLIDFWATWCPPCRKGLPITNKMHEQFASKGLQVMTISDEDQKKVTDFIAENKYTFPAYLDPTKKASAAYQVSAIPTLVIVDAKGNLVSYTVGLDTEEAVLENLKRAGIKVD